MISDNGNLRQQSAEQLIRSAITQLDGANRVLKLESLRNEVPSISRPYLEFVIRKYRNKIIEQADLPF